MFEHLNGDFMSNMTNLWIMNQMKNEEQSGKSNADNKGKTVKSLSDVRSKKSGVKI